MTTILRRWVTPGVLATLALVCAACEGTPPSTLDPHPPSRPHEAGVLRHIAFSYWEAFNAYDADRALQYLEADYRRRREASIRGEISTIKRFRVQLGLTEESPPWVVGPGEREMYLTMKEPMGTRRIRMAFREVAGEWKIVFAEESR